MTTDHAAHLAAKKLWAGLGPGPWVVRNEHDLVGDPLLAEILTATNIYAGDYAGAMARRSMLLGAGVLEAVRNPEGSITYTKTETFPEFGDSLSWVDRDNARLRKQHEWNLAEMEREAEASARVQDMLDAPEQAQFARRLWKAGVTPDHIREIVRAEIEAALAKHFAPAGAE